MGTNATRPGSTIASARLHGVLVTVLGCVYAQAERDERSDAMFSVMATRTCAAIRDLDPFSLID